MDDKLYDIEQILEKLNGLVDDLQEKEYISYFKSLIESFEEDKLEIEEQLGKEAEEEARRRNKEYWDDQF